MSRSILAKLVLPGECIQLAGRSRQVEKVDYVDEDSVRLHLGDTWLTLPCNTELELVTGAEDVQLVE